MIRHAKATVAVSALLLTLLLVPTAIADAPPVVSVEPATPAHTSAQLKGEVNPSGGPSTTFWQLQYAISSDGPWELAGSGEFAGTEAEETTPLPVTANATGLDPNTTYFFRLIAINEDGANQAIKAGPSFTTLEVSPATVAIDPVATFTATSATFSGEVNPNAPKEEAETSDGEKEAFLTAYRFQCTPACPGLEGQLAADNTSHEVEADATGLKPGTEYSVSLIAKNAGPEASAGPEIFTTPALAPIISSFSVSDVDSDTAILHAQLNPAGAATAYRFEYVELAEFDANGFVNAAQAPDPDGSLPAGNANVPLEETITGLDPATPYRFRVVATNALDTTESAPKGFTTFATPQPPVKGQLPGQGFLPDDRVWELVSPTDKEGGAVIGNTTASRAAADGEAFQYGSLQAFADAVGTGISTEYIAERSADPDPGDNGWSTHAITPKQESGTFNNAVLYLGPLYQGSFSADLSRGVFQALSPIGPAPNVEESLNFYLRDDLRSAGAGNYQLLSACPACSKPLPETAGLLPSSAPKYAGASADFGHVVFQSPFNLTDDAPPQSFFCELLGFGCEQRLYEWDHGALRFVGALPDGTGAVRSVSGQGAAFQDGPAIVLHPISADGSRIVFSVHSSSDLADREGDLYSRVNGRTTIPLDASERAVPASPAPSRYWDASADHSRVFFTSGESLTEDAPTTGINLYMWKQADHNETQQVTVDASGGSFILSFNGAATAATGSGDLIGPAAGSGDLSEGSETVSNLSVSGGAFAVGQVVEGPGIPAGTTINEVNPGSLTLSNTATETASAVAITGLVSTKVSNVGAASGAFSIGQPISGAGIAPNTTVTGVLGSGVIELSAPPTATGTGVALSAGTQLAFNAAPAQVTAALEQLAAVKPGNVSVSGGPGSAGGATPYEVTFQGDFAGANVAELGADGSGLSGGAASAAVATTQPVENLTYLNVDGEEADTNNNVQGVIGASEDGRYLYFVADGQLVPGKPLLGAGIGIYLWHEGTISYIGQSSNPGPDAGEWFTGGTIGLNTNQTHVTPDGRHLLLRVKSGTGLLSAHGGSDYDHGSAPFAQFYVYSAEGDELECASCNPSGAAASAQAEGRGRFVAGGSPPRTYQNASRFLSDDGRYAFFSTAEALVPADINKRIDAYRYDTSTGKASLLSSGRSPAGSFFLDASADGKDAFFITQEQLSGWDVDSAYDLYDARVEGGFPEPSPPPPSCQGDACQPPPLALNDATPASSSFAGAGDQEGRKGGKARPRCPQGQRRVKARGGKSRCVRRQGKENRKRATANDRRAGR